jgi:hypothetical protein
LAEQEGKQCREDGRDRAGEDADVNERYDDVEAVESPLDDRGSDHETGIGGLANSTALRVP